MKSLQDTYWPKGTCFGCGPANEKGLRIKSFVQGDEVVADFTPEKHHEAFENVLNGGIVGALLDCHSNWTAAEHLRRTKKTETMPCTVTADFHVRLRKPTPSNAPVHLSAKPVSIEGDKAIIEAIMTSGGKVTATCTGTFVAVGPDHPAYHRW